MRGLSREAQIRGGQQLQAQIVHCATQDQRRYRPQPKPQDQTNPPHTAVWHHPPAPPNTPANTPSTYYRVRHSSNPQYPEITQHRDANYSHHHTPITPTSAPPAPAHVFVYSNETAPASAGRVFFEPEDTTIDHNELKRLPILFYHRTEPHFGFTNFSAHLVEYDGRVYPTSEHLFQALKFLRHRPDIAEMIRTCKTSREAFNTAHRFKNCTSPLSLVLCISISLILSVIIHVICSDVRSDWFDVNIRKMEEVVRLKFTQHPALKEELLSTGNAPLVEAADVDAFWGFGSDGKGRNELGKALMKLRQRFRAEDGRE
ncbi:DUF1768-domain-containing protein [Stereum hirsutum FP-91666 SS1]|uniref:DUF1768-domain-containing protein n=1 Tax=Stereum hirsutum (strain FP-91666) TaxID=721885 RepID=UPI0004449E53|nr:DUF1768-domain-containing protein [Stereum hirsutum FP-91666 SS1]EIM82324.1 DUF1768-domain-containing protein [Stereum hirsutum FP-91666 SS1]